VRADPAGDTAVNGVSAAGDRTTAARAHPRRHAVPQRLQSIPEPPDGCLGSAKVLDPPSEVAIGHPGVLAAMVLGALAVSLVAVIGVGLGGLIRHTAGAATALALIIVGGLTVGQFLPASLRQYLPGIATQAAVTVHRSAGLLRPGTAILVLGVYAAIALAAASIRVAHRDA